MGAENDRETDVSPHELLENVDFGLQHEPPDYDDNDDDRQARIDALVEWFFERYEDPAHRLPYVSAEGGYQWIYGGPYNAREQLGDNFPDAGEDIIEAAVEEIESDGLTDWASVASPEDYDDHSGRNDDDEEEAPRRKNDLSEIVSELDDLISVIPEPERDPVFRLGEDGLVHMAAAPDRQVAASEDGLFDELRCAAVDLCQSLAGTNAHTDLLQAVQNYATALLEDQISISRLYGRGVRLENAALTVRSRIEAEELPSFTAETEQNLNSVLDLHASYIMSQEDGRRLAEGAAAYQRSPEETEALREVAEQIAAAVSQRPDVFSEEVRMHVAEVVQDAGGGPHPERSNQVVVTSLGNMTGSLLKWIGGCAVGAIVAGAVVASAPGAAVIVDGASAINAIFYFLTTNAPLLILLAAAVGSDLSWLSPIAHLLDKLRRRGKK